jgi:hypothetical protein
VLSRVEAEHLRKGVGQRNPARIVHHAALSACAGSSSGSTSTSSSSPR